MPPEPTPTAPATGAPPAPATGLPPLPPAPVAPPPPSEQQGDPSQLGDAGKRALDAEREARRAAEARLKELEPLAAKAQELEDAQKSTEQRLTEQLTAAQTEGATAAGDLLRLQAALAKAPAGMEPTTIASWAGRLRGATKEELEADAEQLFATFGGAAPAAAPPANGGQQTPVEQLRPGALPTNPEPTLPDRIAAAEKAGDWATARSLKSQQLLELHKSKPT